MIEDFFLKSKVGNFLQFKTNFLHAIEKAGKYSYINDEQSISNTDWHLSTNTCPYQDLVTPIIQHHNELLRRVFKYDTVKTTDFWFQQYELGDWHGMHTHGNSSFSNVLYVELPNENIATKYFIKDKEYAFNVEEGEIISFPGILNHHSPVNTGGRKTVFVWNCTVNI